MGNTKPNNSKGFQVDDIVIDDNGNMGKIKEVEYNPSDEVRVEWWGDLKKYRCSRTSIKYLSLFTRLGEFDEIQIKTHEIKE